ncbi:MAG: sugar phosphate isomerase/epimerase family protein [Christensenellales bacterium]
MPQISGANAQRSGDEISRVEELKRGVDSLRNAGCDFIEMSVLSVVDLTNDEFSRFRAYLKENEIEIEVFCSFVPPSIRLIGDDIDRSLIMRYIQKALSRCAACGAKVIVFGSGGARTRPEGFPKEQADRQLLEFLRMCNDCSGAMGLLVKIAIEPLNPAEANMVTGIGEGYELWKKADAAGCRYIGLLADSYHMHVCKDEIGDLKEMAKALIHIHIADADRKLPGKAENGFDFAAFFKALKESGYSGRISAECPMDDLQSDAKYCVDFARGIWEQA